LDLRDGNFWDMVGVDSNLWCSYKKEELGGGTTEEFMMPG
jgi:hypothetical protein